MREIQRFPNLGHNLFENEKQTNNSNNILYFKRVTSMTKKYSPQWPSKNKIDNNKLNMHEKKPIYKQYLFWLNDSMSYIPDVALSYMVRWKKRKSTCQKGKILVQFTNPLLSRIRPKLARKIISKVANLPCPLDNLQ